MTYTPTAWVDGSTYATAARLNNMEAGIVRANSVVIDARDYGVLADNTANDTTAIQAALDAAVIAVPGTTGNDRAGAIVQLPPGRCRVSQIAMPDNVWLRGTGQSGTYLQATSSTLDVIVLKTSATVQCTITDLGILGGSTPTAGAGINLVQSGFASILGDSRHVISDVVIVGTFRGIEASGGTEVRIDRVTIQRPVERGIYTASTDMFISNTTVGAAGSNAFDIFGGNTRIWGCKAFGGGDGSHFTRGFHLTGAGRHEVSCCEVQDFDGTAFGVDGNDRTVLSACTADSVSGYCFDVGGSGTAHVDGVAVLRSGGLHTPEAAVRATSWLNNYIRVTTSGTFPMMDAATSVGSSIVIGNTEGTQAIAYASTITPDVYLGGQIYVGTLTGNITINNPATTLGAFWIAGTRLAFTLTQDATAGRTTTFGSAYTLVGGALGSTGANVTRRIEFEYLGDAVGLWRETVRN
jgi:hypothetical protein